MPISKNRVWSTLLALAAVACGTPRVFAQSSPPLAQVPATSGATQPDPGAFASGEQVLHLQSDKAKLTLVEQQSKIIELPNKILSVEGFDPETLAVEAVSANRIRVQADTPGVTNLVLTDEFNAVFTIEVLVEADTRELQVCLARLFPECSIQVVPVKDSVVLRGWVAEPDRLTQITTVAKEHYPTIHNQLKVGGPSQVQLRVKVLEVQRSKLRRMGVNFLFLGQDYFVHSGPGGLAPLSASSAALGGPVSATINPSSLANSSLQFAIAGSSNIFSGFVDVLQSEGMAKVLAEPTVVATSGRPATLLSGGEFPILVPGSVGTVSIQYREFGVRMEALPIVLGNGRLRLEIAPEVSERDVSSAIEVNGFVVPGISTRRINTQVEMRFGETLMIGGLIQKRKSGTTQKLPFLGELPYVGALFSRKSYEYGDTELLILVTPLPSAPMQSSQVPYPNLNETTDNPTDKELYMYGFLEVPSYGPECPEEECELSPGWGDSGMPGENMPGSRDPYEYQQPVPGMIPPGAVQQTKAERTSSKRDRVVTAEGRDPFRVKVDRTPSQSSSANTPARVDTRRPRSTAPLTSRGTENESESSLITPSRTARTFPETAGHSAGQ